MKKINRSIRLLFLAVLALGLVSQEAQLHGQATQLKQRAAQLQSTVSQSFQDFYRYFKERFPNVAATP